MKKKSIYNRIIPFLLILFYSCGIFSIKSDQDSNEISRDEKHYIFPKQKIGHSYWSLITENNNQSLEERLLQESLSGLSALAVNENRSQTMVWIQSNSPTYQRLQENIPMQNIGNIDIWSLLSNKKQTSEWVEGYILYDTENPESINVATVAAHVYKGILIDKKDSIRASKMGYKMLYNASHKSLTECWNEFKSHCNNDGLILMPALTSNQRSTAIAYKWMIVNLYKKLPGKNVLSNNKILINNILMNLRPLSPVIGWEQSASEDEFVSLVSQSGNIMLPFDWAINTPILSAGYEKSKKVQAVTLNPNQINYGDAENYVAFWLSDGDNIQWMINAFDTPSYYDNPYADQLRISFGYPFTGLSMVNPAQHTWLVNKQPKNTSLIESLGGGYYYPDNFGKLKNRDSIMDQLSSYLAAHMNDSGSKVLGLICQDISSNDAFEAYQKYISANKNLIGIVALQYAPYAGGNGEIYWFKNNEGINIPVITARYSIWNCGASSNREREGTPAYIAKCYNDFFKNASRKTFSITSVHAWSTFKDTQGDTNLTSENDPSGKQECGITPVKWCVNRLTSDFKIVNAEELIWQLRMHTFPEQTKLLLSSYK